MAIATPDWLSKRGGELRPTSDGRSWVVFLDKEPQYMLTPVPVAGKHGCQVKQTINGKRLDSGSSHATLEDAVRGGLDDLRKALGW